MINDNSLVRRGRIWELSKIEMKQDWDIHKDREGVYMIYYKNIPVENIIFAVGEISLAMTSSLNVLQNDYYSTGDGDIFNIALKLLRDNDFASEFYSTYSRLEENL